jgi:hypothetical protein
MKKTRIKYMAIKNWTVTAESTKSASAREIYLHDKNHSNHRNTERIINIFGSAKTSININRNLEAYKLQTALKGKGGRPPTPAMEFVLALPQDQRLRPTDEQWKNITKYVGVAIAKKLQVEPKILSKILRAVVHQQKHTSGKNGSGDHCHLIVGKFTDEGVYLRDLQKKGVLYVIKQAFNKAVFNELGVDNADYVAHKNYEGTAKKRAPQWKVKAARVNEALNIKERNLNQAQAELDQRASDADQRELEIDQKAKSLEEAQRTVDKFEVQALKLQEAFILGDYKQIKRQTNRLKKTVEEAEQQNHTEDNLSFMNNLSGLINADKPKHYKAVVEDIPKVKPSSRSPRP